VLQRAEEALERGGSVQPCNAHAYQHPDAILHVSNVQVPVGRRPPNDPNVSLTVLAFSQRYTSILTFI